MLNERPPDYDLNSKTNMNSNYFVDERGICTVCLCTTKAILKRVWIYKGDNLLTAFQFHIWDLDSPISQWEALLLQSLSPYCLVYRELFQKQYKTPMSALLLDILCLAVLSQWAQIHSAKLHALSLKGMDGVFWSESALKRGACCMSSPVNGPCSHNLWLQTFSALAGPAERELLHMYRSQYVQTYPGGSTGCDLLKDVMAMESRIQLYIRESQTIDRVPARHQWGQCLSMASIILPTAAIWAEVVSSLSHVLMAFHSKQVGDTQSLPSDNHRLHCRAEEVSWWKTLNLCCKVNYQ